MTESDLYYIDALIKAGIIKGSVLELGAGYGGKTCKEVVLKNGFMYCSTDIQPSDGLDYVADFSDRGNLNEVFGGRKFDAVFVLNVLEHTFDPVAIIDNALSLVKGGGVLVIITPAVWPLHGYPIDCNRLLPNFYEEFAKRRPCELFREYFNYIGYGKVDDYSDECSGYRLPFPNDGKGLKYWWSRIIHKLFNTCGRSMSFPSHVAIGAVFVRNDDET